MDLGITETDFWGMTFAELDRLFKSKIRMNRIKEREQASFDYILADLIGRSIARLYNSSNKMPTIGDAYPSLFADEEIQEEKQKRMDEISAIRIKQFAQFHNKKYKEAAKTE